MKRWFKRYNLSAGSAGYGAAMALVLALLLLASGVTPAAAQLEPPHQFYGNVYVGAGSSPAAAGTKIEARVNNVKQAETTVDSAGRYGYSPLFKVPGSTGTVTFYIGTTKAVQEVAWAGGGINRNDGQPLHLSDTVIDLTITTTSLTAGQVGTFYTRTLGVSGGTAPYTWSLYNGSLPAGLSGPSASGVISGMPTADGTSSFTVKVTDAVSATATKSLSITIGSEPPPPPGGKLIGADDDMTCVSGVGSNHFCLTRFQAEQDGDISTFKLKACGSGNVKVAIYNDSSGEPGARLNAVDTSTAVTAGVWNDISITPTHVDAGSYYWLAMNSDSNIVCYNDLSVYLSRCRSAIYTGFNFPSSAGTGFFTGSIMLLAGYGSGGDAPTRLTPAINSVTFSWNAVSGATLYHLQVSTSSGFGTTVEDDNNITGTSKQVTGLSGGTYYWRVKAYTTEWGSWSSTGSVIGQ